MRRKDILTLLWVVSMLFTYYAVKSAESAEREKGQALSQLRLGAGMRAGLGDRDPGPPVVDPSPGAPVIQIALLLDTSNSMDGLIGQAKQQLWDVVNEFAEAKQGGKRAQLQVALYEYGNSRLAADTGYIRRVLHLTTDLDMVSEKLFALQTSGGDEYCGGVIAASTRELEWNPSPKALKTIYIAGNEAFTQGKANFRDACRDAIRRGITVNTIFCGDYGEGVQTAWKDGATLGDGSYANIDQNRVVADAPTPHDRRLTELNAALNRTYIPYGTEGRTSASRQMAQDGNAATLGAGVVARRSAAKASSQYENSRWDLVDALKQGKVRLSAREAVAALPAVPAEEREAHIEKVSAERTRIQAEIRKLSGERTRYLSEQVKDKSTDTSLRSALTGSLRTQAARKGYTLK